MDKYLLISLGHNASAIFTSKNVTIGYEQERLDGIKSSSQFPYDAISEIIKSFRSCDSNPGGLGTKCELYLCTMAIPQFL